MGSGFSKKKKQARAFQEQMEKLQEQMKSAEATGSAGGGLVEMTLNGEHEMVKIKIKPDCVDPDDIEGLEMLIKAAYNEANDKLKKESMPDIPGMPNMGGGLPF